MFRCTYAELASWLAWGNRITGSTIQGGHHGILCILRYPNGGQCSVLSQLREGHGSGKRCRRFCTPTANTGAACQLWQQWRSDHAVGGKYSRHVCLLHHYLGDHISADRAIQSQSLRPFPLVSVPLYRWRAYRVASCIVVGRLRSAVGDVSHLGTTLARGRSEEHTSELQSLR